MQKLFKLHDSRHFFRICISYGLIISPLNRWRVNLMCCPSLSTRSTRASTEYIVEWKVAINIPGRCPDNRLLQGPARPHLQVAGAPQAQSHPRPGHGQVSVSTLLCSVSPTYLHICHLLLASLYPCYVKIVKVSESLKHKICSNERHGSSTHHFHLIT